MLKILAKSILICCLGFSLVSMREAEADRYGIKVANTRVNARGTAMTNIDAGPCVGNIFNYHYFPGLLDYAKGNYFYAMEQLDYFLDRPHYTSMNPRHAEFHSYGYYIRGMMFLYHASGSGRLVLAKEDFEKSIRWNPKAYRSYLELAGLFSKVDLKEQAIQVLQQLLEQKPEEEIAQQARKMLQNVQSKNTK